MNTNTNNAAMDGRLPQFHGGQGLVSGYGGLAGNMLTLQNLQGAAAAGYGLQTQIQAGRPGFGSMPPSNQTAQQRMGLNRNLQLSLGQAPRVALNAQQTQQQYGLANLAQRTQQQQQPAASQAQLAGLAPTQLRGLAQQGAAGPVNGLGPATYSSLALLHQQQQAQRSVPGGTGPTAVNRGLGARLGMLGGATGNTAGGLAPGTTGYSAPSGDLLSMLSKAAASQGGLGLGLGGPGTVPGGEATAEPASRQPAAFDTSSTDFPSLGAPTGTRTLFGEVAVGTAPPEEDFPALPGSALASSGAAQQQQQGQAARLPAQEQPSEQARVSTRYGLLGLTSIIRAPEAESSALVLGFDLTSLGLSLNQAGPIWKDFSSPFAEGPAPAEQEFQVPACYQHTAPRLTPAYFAKLVPDTLFYIFYGMPGDEAQVLAAEELTHRGWYFHKELKAWLTAVPNTEPSQKTDRFERGSFFVFDPASWEVARRDNFVVQFEHLERSPPLPGRQPVST